MRMRWQEDRWLRRINILLLTVIIVVNGYVVVTPLLPRVNYEVKQRIAKPVQVDPARPDTISRIDRSRNHLILPALQLDEPVYDGPGVDTLNTGIWRRPNTSTPAMGGNTVLAGHRFAYRNAAFYNLDKLRAGDDIYLVYDQKIYHYSVRQMLIVSPDALRVEAPTSDNILTLYTCTPLWTSKQRLVYIANLIGVK